MHQKWQMLLLLLLPSLPCPLTCAPSREAALQGAWELGTVFARVVT